MKRHIRQGLGLLLLVLSFGQYNCIFDMQNNIFKSTGKQRGTVGWRSQGSSGALDAVDDFFKVYKPGYQAELIALLMKGDIPSIKLFLKRNNIPIHEPVIVESVGNRTTYRYYYLLEYVIYSKYPAGAFEAILEYAPELAHGCADYSPLKDLLLNLSSSKNSSFANGIFKKYLEILIERSADHSTTDLDEDLSTRNTINLDAVLPDHIGFGLDDSDFKGYSARTLLEQTKTSWNQKVWAEVKALFDNIPVQKVAASTDLHSAKTPVISPEKANDRTIFAPTGKVIDSDGWREAPAEVTERPCQESIVRLWMGYNTHSKAAEVQGLMDGNSLTFDQPWLNNQRSGRFYYPIEYCIYWKFMRGDAFDAFLDLSPYLVHGFTDYNPLKDILEIMTNPERSDYYQDKLSDYAVSLINHGINLYKPFPDHNGFGRDTSLCKNAIPVEYIAGIIQNDSLIGASNIIKHGFSKIIWAVEKKLSPQEFERLGLVKKQEPTRQIHQTPVQPITAEPQPAPSASTASVSREDLKRTLLSQGFDDNYVNQWLTSQAYLFDEAGKVVQPSFSPALQANPTVSPLVEPHRDIPMQPRFSRKTFGALVLMSATALVVAAKLTYNRWFTTKTTARPDLKITIQNDTGLAGDVILHNHDGTTITRSLAIDGSCTEDIKNIDSLSFIGVSEQGIAQAPLSITLESYKAYRAAESADLHITLSSSNGFWPLWYSMPYAYQVAWQELTK